MKYILIVCVLLFAACTSDNKLESLTPNQPTPEKNTYNPREYIPQKPLKNQNAFILQSKGLAVPNAEVYINDNLVGSTDLNGAIQINSEWALPATLSFKKAGYITTSFHQVPQQAQLFTIDPVEGDGRIEVRGETLGYGRLKKDDVLDFSILVPTLTTNSLIHFDMSYFISSETDKINIVNGVKVMGAKNILNNLALSASSLYAKNLSNFVSNLYDKEKKDIFINQEDEIISKTLINKEL